MTVINLIAAVDEAGGLGLNNQLLCHLPADLHYFKKTTMGKPIIMGRNTFESIGRPLPGRKNIVLSRTPSLLEGVTMAPSFSLALELCKEDLEIFVIGGAELFKQAIDLADRIYLTLIHHQFIADVFFPIINPKAWYCVSRIEKQSDENNQFNMSFIIYERSAYNQSEQQANKINQTD